MSSGLQILSLAEALAGYAATRQTLLARNVAHADTPGFKARDLAPFSGSYAAESAMEGGGALRPAATRPGHAGAPPDPTDRAVDAAAIGAASPNGNTVALEDQMVRAAEVRLQHDMALGVWRKSLDILRATFAPPR